MEFRLLKSDYNLPENRDVQTRWGNLLANINVVPAPKLTRTSRVVILKASDVPVYYDHPKIVLCFYYRTVQIGQNGPNSWETVGFHVNT